MHKSLQSMYLSKSNHVTQIQSSQNILSHHYIIHPTSKMCERGRGYPTYLSLGDDFSYALHIKVAGGIY